jgi:LPXTG-motif cell wall-anchored protein
MKTVALLLAACLFFTLAGSAAAQTAAWLDGRPAAWNAPGGAVPPATPGISGNVPRCLTQERAAAGAEEEQVVRAGWRLESYWPTARAGDLAVVVATSDYDGMCRPTVFNGFVFAGGRFAGTLSPDPMAARTDGVLNIRADGATVRVADGKVEARFVRYAATDPLCCPSRGHTVVTYRVGPGPQLLVESRVGEPPAAAPAPAPAPTQLPRTGDLDPAALAALGAASALGGLALRRRAA